MLVKYLLVFLIAIIAITTPEIYGVYAGVQINRTLVMLSGLAVTYLAWFLIRPRPYGK